MNTIEKLERLESELKSVNESLKGHGAQHFDNVRNSLRKDKKLLKKSIANLKNHAEFRQQIGDIAENLLLECGKPYEQSDNNALIMLINGNFSISDIEQIENCYSVRFNVSWERV